VEGGGMKEKRVHPPIVRRLLVSGGVLLVAVAILLVFASCFVSFTIQNFRQQSADIVDVNASRGLIFQSQAGSLDRHQIGTFWGLLPSKNILLEVVIQDGGVPKNFTCTANRQGSDSCSVEIYEHAINCECFQ